MGDGLSFTVLLCSKRPSIPSAVFLYIYFLRRMHLGHPVRDEVEKKRNELVVNGKCRGRSKA